MINLKYNKMQDHQQKDISLIFLINLLNLKIKMIGLKKK